MLKIIGGYLLEMFKILIGVGIIISLFFCIPLSWHKIEVVPPPVEIFIQEGTASWYGKPFHGKRASDGSVYNMHEYTAASRFLAFGVRVRVVSVDTGKSVVVTITDRGPYIQGRIIDLSKAAAEQLGIRKQGVAIVKIYAIQGANDAEIGKCVQ